MQLTGEQAKGCGIGHGANCCIYLTVSGTGFCCEKITEIGKLLFQKASVGDMSARRIPDITTPFPDCQKEGVKEISKVRLENWSIIRSYDPYKPPEAQPAVLVGVCYGHPQLPDGEKIKTSAIQEFILSTEVRTQNTVYILGEIDPQYKEYRENHKD